MKISHKIEYACRVLGQLARRFGKSELAHIEDLARAEQIPANYLVQILNDLRNGGLINSRRGKQGGYALARHPSEITLLQITRVIDGELLSMNVSERGQSGQRVAEVWMEIAGKFEKLTDSYTLESIASPDSQDMYYI